MLSATERGTFDVYSAGGLGREPKMGVMTASDIEPAKILYYIKAMIDTFTAYGNYENRAKSRTRFMQDTLGTERYLQAYQEKLNLALASEQLDLRLTVPEIHKQGTKKTLEHPRAIPQKQEGLYAVCCAGNMDFGQDIVGEMFFADSFNACLQKSLGIPGAYLAYGSADAGDGGFKIRLGAVFGESKNCLGFPGRQVDNIKAFVRGNPQQSFLHRKNRIIQAPEELRRHLTSSPQKFYITSKL